MKINKNTFLFISAIVLLLLAYRINDPFGQFQLSLHTSKPLLSVSLSSLDSISVFSGDSLLYKLTNKNGDWFISENGKDYLARASLVENTFSPLFNIKRFQSIGADKKLAEKFSLNDKGLKTVFQQGQKKESIYLATAENRNLLLRLADEKEIFASDAQQLYALQKTPQYFRDKSILRLEKENIDVLEFFAATSAPPFLKVNHKNELWFLQANYLANPEPEKECNQNFVNALQNFLKAQGETFLTQEQMTKFSPYAKINILGRSNNSYNVEILKKPAAKENPLPEYAVKGVSNQWMRVSSAVIDGFLLADRQNRNQNISARAWAKILQDTWTKKP